jgi:hypothetical protein
VKVGGKESQSSTLRIEATFSSEMSVDFQRTTQNYIPEDRILLLNELIELLLTKHVALKFYSQNSGRTIYGSLFGYLLF